MLAKCYKGLGDLKTCIASCNSAIEHNSKWKEPFLYRAACFQASVVTNVYDRISLMKKKYECHCLVTNN